MQKALHSQKFNLVELMRLLTNPAGYSDNEWLEKRVCECVNEPMRLPLRGSQQVSLQAC